MFEPAQLPEQFGIPELLTIDETAQAFRKTVRQLRWMIQQGDAPPHAKFGGRIMFRRADVVSFIEAKFQPTTPEEGNTL